MDSDRASLRLLGGALVGAASAALVPAVLPLGPWQPLAALAMAAGCLALSVVLGRRVPWSTEALLAAAVALAGAMPFFAFASPILATLAVGIVVAATGLHAARSPLALGAAVAFFTSARHATQVDLLRGDALLPSVLFLVALVAYAGLLLAQPRGRWRSYALALAAGGIVLALFPLLDALDVTAPVVAALGVGGVLVALLAAAIALGERPLAMLAGVGLAGCALTLAFVASGAPLAAAILLLAGAAALLWRGGRSVTLAS